MVGEDGNVYEGRGWDQVGAHTYGYNTVGLGKYPIQYAGVGCRNVTQRTGLKNFYSHAWSKFYPFYPLKLFFFIIYIHNM